MLSLTATLPSRRLLLLGGLGIAGPRHSTASSTGHLYRFRTDLCSIRLSVEFHDRYSSRALQIRSVLSDEPICLALKGERNDDCAGGFVGSLAICRYEVRSHENGPKVSTMREHVRTIDRDERLELRPPFRRKVELHKGVASDVQAFGYRENGLTAIPVGLSGSDSPWYYFRQDLYLEGKNQPFLIIHWKHALSAIRMLDLIPASGTSIVTG